jgi:Predicted deacylase
LAGQGSASRIAHEIDFDAEGRQAGYLRAPLSRNTSGWGVVEIPVAVIARGRGPTVLFTGGIHGSEYEGQIAVSELARTLDPGAVQGRVILMPAVNIPAVHANTRLSPSTGAT